MAARLWLAVAARLRDSGSGGASSLASRRSPARRPPHLPFRRCISWRASPLCRG